MSVRALQAHVFVCVRVCVCLCVFTCMCVCVCVYANTVCNAETNTGG